MFDPDPIADLPVRESGDVARRVYPFGCQEMIVHRNTSVPTKGDALDEIRYRVDAHSYHDQIRQEPFPVLEDYRSNAFIALESGGVCVEFEDNAVFFVFALQHSADILAKGSLERNP
jgi:hypothetical protein